MSFPHYIIGVIIFILILYKIKLFFSVILILFLFVFLEVVYKLKMVRIEGLTYTNSFIKENNLTKLFIGLLESLSLLLIYVYESRIYKQFKLNKINITISYIFNIATSFIHIIYLGFPKWISKLLLNDLRGNYFYGRSIHYLRDLISIIGEISITQYKGFLYAQINDEPLLNEKLLLEYNLTIILEENYFQLTQYKSSFIEVIQRREKTLIIFNRIFKDKLLGLFRDFSELEDILESKINIKILDYKIKNNMVIELTCDNIQGLERLNSYKFTLVNIENV